MSTIFLKDISIIFDKNPITITYDNKILNIDDNGNVTSTLIKIKKDENMIHLNDITPVSDYPVIYNGKILEIDDHRDVNWVFNFNNSMYRLIINSEIQYGRWGRIQEFMRGREAKELMNRGFIPRYELTNMKLEGYENGDVYKIIDNVFCVYDDEGENFRTVGQQLDCLRLVCDISFLLEEMKSSYFLTDVSFFNVGFNYSKPVFIDVGSFSTVGKFWISESIQKMLNFCGNHSGHYFNLHFKNNWYNLREDLNKVTIKLEKGEWGEYSNLSHLEYESKIAFEWLESKSDIKTIIDVGCGNGEFSKLFCYKGYNIIAIDYNEYCIDRLYKSSSGMNIFCMKMDIIKDYTSILGRYWKEYISGDVAFCSSIMHHLYHSENNMTFEKQETLWNKIATKYLIIEYIDKNDSCLVDWTFGEDYTKDNFLKSFDENWELLDTKPSEYPDRCWYFFKKREHILKGDTI